MTARTPRTPFTRAARWVSRDVVGGVIMIASAVLGLLLANSPAGAAYAAFAQITVGPAALHLDLPLSVWAADGLLAIFFFVVGVELKRELVAGSLRNPRIAGVPIIAAVAGMLVPAAIYAAVVLSLGEVSALRGWAIPTATDIAFALAVLALFGRGLPVALRVFLLTLAVVDDLLAIIVIAVFYSDGVRILPLAGAVLMAGVFAILIRRPRMRWWMLLPVALGTWVLMHESGVHATIAGVLLGVTVPARAVHDETVPRTVRLEHAVRPVSAGIALPVFAFFAAGVPIGGGAGGPLAVLSDPVSVAIVAALVVGKLVGVLGSTALVTRLTPLRLPDSIGLRDLLPIGLLTGIGFTVSLLIAELSFRHGEHAAAAKIGVLAASLTAAILAGVLLRWDAHRQRRADMNEDGIADTSRFRIGDQHAPED
ncbi:Na+/H+ antiporter NhaA [Microbacterium sp. NPDC019599]|uniref:Na+/H+ antiporter NhaA n=1 Tax=Microbacterium sp. NPDC019599 TaxID=3154690 RepID=UPI0033E8862C